MEATAIGSATATPHRAPSRRSIQARATIPSHSHTAPVSRAAVMSSMWRKRCKGQDIHPVRKK